MKNSFVADFNFNFTIEKDRQSFFIHTVDFTRDQVQYLRVFIDGQPGILLRWNRVEKSIDREDGEDTGLPVELHGLIIKRIERKITRKASAQEVH